MEIIKSRLVCCPDFQPPTIKNDNIRQGSYSLMSASGIQHDLVKINIFSCYILLFHPHLVPHAVVTASWGRHCRLLLLFFTLARFIHLDSGTSSDHDCLHRPVLLVDSVRFGPYCMSNLFPIISRTSFRWTSQQRPPRRVCCVRADTRRIPGAAFVPSVGPEASVNCQAESYR